MFIHGFCEAKEIWMPLIPALQETSTIIAIDLPGFGKSGLIKNTTLDVYAEAIKSVLDYEKIKRCILIGHSMGGYTTLTFTRKFPERLDAIGLFHSHPFEDDEFKKENRSKAIKLVSKFGSERYVRELTQGLFTQFFISANPEAVEAFLQLCQKTKEETVIQALQIMRDRSSNEEALKNYTGKGLFNIGKEDSTVTYNKSLEMAAMPSCSLIHIMENCGHMGMTEYPKESIKVIKEFLQFV